MHASTFSHENPVKMLGKFFNAWVGSCSFSKHAWCMTLTGFPPSMSTHGMLESLVVMDMTRIYCFWCLHFCSRFWDLSTQSVSPSCATLELLLRVSTIDKSGFRVESRGVRSVLSGPTDSNVPIYFLESKWTKHKIIEYSDSYENSSKMDGKMILDPSIGRKEWVI